MVLIIDKSGGKKFQKTSQTYYDVKKLTRNTNYTICVQAENIVGKSNKTCSVIQTLNKGNLFNNRKYTLVLYKKINFQRK